MGIRPIRINVDLPAVYEFRGIRGEGRLIDISIGGAALEVKQIFVPGDLIRVSFQLPDSGHNVEFWGIVRNVKGTEIGLSYEEISNADKEKIEEFVNKLIKETGLPYKEEF